MGLGASRKRFKLSHDPNNTTWSRSDTKYGQKILKSHGWTPGELLGASGTAYSNLRSAASASHIRIALKDDNLGLGAKHGTAHNSSETAGLDMFQDLLRRLNGAGTTDVKEDRLQRSKLRSSAYIDERWGKLLFVSGGLLVGDKPGDLTAGEQNVLKDSQQTQSQSGALPVTNRVQEIQSDTSKRKRNKKRKTSGDDHSGKAISKRVNWRPLQLMAQSPIDPLIKPEGEYQNWPKNMYDHLQINEVRMDAKQVKRKLKRQVKIDQRLSLKVREQSSILPLPELILNSSCDTGEIAVASHPLRETSASTRVSRGCEASRHAVRHRYIQHKKMCMMDNKALNEILMIKA